MKVPFEWLNDFIDLTNVLPEALAEEISLKAFEVETVDYLGAKLTGPLVAGVIKEIQKHPNADKLQITKTQIAADKEPVQIVCGAKNIKVGQVVPVALPGAIVLNRKTNEQLAIKIGKIRDIESCGMLCSANELGMDSDSDGIYILDSEIKIGTNLIEHLNLSPKAVLEVESRSNRGDALCLMGIAREVAVILNKPLKKNYSKELEEFNKLSQMSNSLLSSSVAAKEDCSKIGFLQIDNLIIKESPKWLSERLIQAGISSINNVVDVTNYTMLELGQPMHAYDSSSLDLKQPISVSKEHKGAFKGLDEKDYLLNENHLLITNANKVLAIAGVMGGKESSVKETTNSIVLEAACFESSSVRATSRSVGTTSESSRRFERGTDPKLIEIALMRAAKLILEIAGGEISSYSVTVNDQKLSNKKRSIEFNLDDFSKVIGFKLKNEEALQILQNLGFIVKTRTENLFEVEVPSHRLRDIERPIDLIEELARFAGLNKIESKPLPGVTRLLPKDSKLNKLKEKLTKQGYLENISSSLVPAGQEKGFFEQGLVVKMLNPLSNEHSELRTSLLGGLIKATENNLKRQANSVRLFELGKIYGFEASGESLKELNPKETSAKENLILAIFCSTKSNQLDWQGRQAFSGDFYEVKGIIEEVVDGLGKLEFKRINKNDSSLNTLLHPNISAEILLNGRKFGYLGLLHPLLVKHHNLAANTFVAEVSAEAILKDTKFKLKAIHDQPLLVRDFTIDLKAETEISHKQIEDTIKKLKFTDLLEIKLLTLYKSKDKDLSSLSYRLVFQNPTGNVLGETVNVQIKELKETLQKDFADVSFRDG